MKVQIGSVLAYLHFDVKATITDASAAGNTALDQGREERHQTSPHLHHTQIRNSYTSTKKGW